MDKHTRFEEVRDQLGPALESKVKEFHLYGYDRVSSEGLWDYLVNKKWEKKEGTIRLHIVISDILRVKSGDFMNYTTRTEYKAASLNVGLNEEELQLLLHGQSNGQGDSLKD